MNEKELLDWARQPSDDLFDDSSTLGRGSIRVPVLERRIADSLVKIPEYQPTRPALG